MGIKSQAQASSHRWPPQTPQAIFIRTLRQSGSRWNAILCANTVPVSAGALDRTLGLKVGEQYIYEWWDCLPTRNALPSFGTLYTIDHVSCHYKCLISRTRRTFVV